jgi:anaerobic sulfite reductase subunit A
MMSKSVKNKMGLTGMSVLAFDDVKTVNFSRERLYAFLSGLFAKEVDEEELEAIIAAQPTMTSLASSLETQEMGDGSKLLQDFVDQVKLLKNGEKKGLITDLRAEYAALFLAVGMPYRGKARHKGLLTCESAYLGKHGMYYDKPFSEVKDEYSKSGFEKRKDFLEPEDHIAIELDFMANLCRQTHLFLDQKNTQNALRYLKLQKEFLRDHLTRWVPDLCESMNEAAESKLYKSLAHLTNGFISMEEQVVEELAKTLETLPDNKTKHTAR